MMTNINWSDIKNGFKGFENFAYTFVKKRYPNSRWEKTPETRDGNKDACALILGYQPYPDKPEQWWMEAKYSSGNKKISRYRLDATIVSAILEGNVTKVIFVTNLLISSKSIIDIRNVLQSSIKCEEVIFCSRHTLELWLSQNLSVYKKFFKHTSNLNNINLQVPDLCITQDVDYYSETASHFVFKEPLRELRRGGQYIAYFEVFSSDYRTLTLKKGSDIIGLRVLSNKKIVLKPGENQIQFGIRIEKNYCSRKNKAQPPIPYFNLGSIEVPSSRALIPSLDIFPQLDIPSQSELMDSLRKEMKKFKKYQNNTYCFVEGISGIGKSFLTSKVLSDEVLEKEPVFYGNFSDSAKTNNEILVNLILFLLFPYLSTEHIDFDYLKNVQNGYLSPGILEIVKYRYDFDMLTALLDNHQYSDGLIPMKMSINRRYIVFDDLQKLDTIRARFLLAILIELQQKQLPIFAICLTQPSFLKINFFISFKEQCTIKHYNYSISEKDIANCLNQIKKAPNQITDIAHTLKFSVVELLVFAKYLLSEEMPLENMRDILFACTAFRRSSLLEHHIHGLFKNLFGQCPECRAICDLVYWSCNPIVLQEDAPEHKYVTQLIIAGLVKYNDDDALIPCHDIYRGIYRNYFAPLEQNRKYFESGSPEFLKNSIHNDIKPSDLKKSINNILELHKGKKYYSILYILQEAFETSSKQELVNKLDEFSYFQLLFIYSYASHQQNAHTSCHNLFQDIYERTYESSNPKLLLICLDAIWELIVIHYENLQYALIKTHIKILLELIIKLQQFGEVSKNMKEIAHYHNVLTINTLISADYEKKDTHTFFIKRAEMMRCNKFVYRAHSFRARYALTLVTKDMPLCLEYLDEERNYFEREYDKEDKHYLWCDFYFEFYSMIWKEQPERLEHVLEVHERMKINQYNNYRKKLYGLAAFHFSQNNLSEGHRCLFKDTLFEREVRSRHKGFYHSTLALQEAVNKNNMQAVIELKNAKTLFDPLPGYQLVINHNLRLLEDGRCDLSPVKFWFGENMDNNTYYIDPRCVW